MAIECLTRNHTPYGRLSDTACDWMVAQRILRWNGENWVYLKRKITAGVNRYDAKGRTLPTKESETCYDSMLLDFAIKRLAETPSMETLSETELVEYIIANGVNLKSYEDGLEKKYHMSKLLLEEASREW